MILYYCIIIICMWGVKQGEGQKARHGWTNAHVSGDSQQHTHTHIHTHRPHTRTCVIALLSSVSSNTGSVTAAPARAAAAATDDRAELGGWGGAPAPGNGQRAAAWVMPPPPPPATSGRLCNVGRMPSRRVGADCSPGWAAAAAAGAVAPALTFPSPLLSRERGAMGSRLPAWAVPPSRSHGIMMLVVSFSLTSVRGSAGGAPRNAPSPLPPAPACGSAVGRRPGIFTSMLPEGLGPALVADQGACGHAQTVQMLCSFCIIFIVTCSASEDRGQRRGSEETNLRPFHCLSSSQTNKHPLPSPEKPIIAGSLANMYTLTLSAECAGPVFCDPPRPPAAAASAERRVSELSPSSRKSYKWVGTRTLL